MISVYAHLNPLDFEFSSELDTSIYTYNNIPDFAYLSFEQTEKKLGVKPIVLTNSSINKNDKDKINEFYKLCKTGFPSFAKDPFWLTTLLRLYIVFLYCKQHNITEFVHLEYDNLIYSDLKELKTLPPSLYFTRVGPFCSSAGFTYCNSLNRFELFIEKIILLFKKGEQTVASFTKYTHLSEMILIDLIHTHTKDVIDYLPILPNGIGSDNFGKLQILFDGASYGQYLGGTNNGDKKGWYGMHHYVGQEIHNNNIKIVFDTKPYVVYNDQHIPLANLHIHSKDLKQFI